MQSGTLATPLIYTQSQYCKYSVHQQNVIARTNLLHVSTRSSCSTIPKK